MSPSRLMEELSTPPEPIQIKKQILEVKASLGEGGGIDWDSLAVWYGNRIPRYLWSECGWKSVLSGVGFTWQRFLKLMKYHTTDMVLWVGGGISWEEFMQKLRESVEGPLGQMVRKR